METGNEIATIKAISYNPSTYSLALHLVLPSPPPPHPLCLPHQFHAATDMPSDAQRVQYVKTLVDAGYAHRVMLAHDIHTKHRLVRSQGDLWICGTQGVLTPIGTVVTAKTGSKCDQQVKGYFIISQGVKDNFCNMVLESSGHSLFAEVDFGMVKR